MPRIQLLLLHWSACVHEVRNVICGNLWRNSCTCTYQSKQHICSMATANRFFFDSESASSVWANDSDNNSTVIFVPLVHLAGWLLLFFSHILIFLTFSSVRIPDCIWSAFNVLLVLSLCLINRLCPIGWSIKSSSNPVYLDECVHVHVHVMVLIRYWYGTVWYGMLW